MSADKDLNLWMASTTAERDALGSEVGLSVGDFCLVDGLNLYVALQVFAMASTWRPLAGVPTRGLWSVSGKNTSDATPYTLTALTAVSFRAVLDAAPSSITLLSTAFGNWPNLPSVFGVTAHGFVLAGTSDMVAAGVSAWQHGTYIIIF